MTNKFYDTISVSAFMSLFGRDFPYLPFYVYGKTYFKGDVVYSSNNFYESLSDNNTAVPSNTTYWKLVNGSKDDYISENDIIRAFTEARVNFNPNLFEDCEIASTVFYYLTAHYLVIDLNNANNPLAMGLMGFATSKHVGSVSESYGIPQWMLNSKTLGLYAQTGYGRKYLSLIAPYLVGNIIYTPGATTIG